MFPFVGSPLWSSEYWKGTCPCHGYINPVQVHGLVRSPLTWRQFTSKPVHLVLPHVVRALLSCYTVVFYMIFCDYVHNTVCFWGAAYTVRVCFDSAAVSRSGCGWSHAPGRGPAAAWDCCWRHCFASGLVRPLAPARGAWFWPHLDCTSRNPPLGYDSTVQYAVRPRPRPPGEHQVWCHGFGSRLDPLNGWPPRFQ